MATDHKFKVRHLPTGTRGIVSAWEYGGSSRKHLSVEFQDFRKAQQVALRRYLTTPQRFTMPDGSEVEAKPVKGASWLCVAMNRVTDALGADWRLEDYTWSRYGHRIWDHKD